MIQQPIFKFQGFLGYFISKEIELLYLAGFCLHYRIRNTFYTKFMKYSEIQLSSYILRRPPNLKLLCTFKINWEIFTKFCGLIGINEYGIGCWIPFSAPFSIFQALKNYTSCHVELQIVKFLIFCNATL